ncbi:MMPL family transporter [Hoyosella rhizosphaerae]|uniref:Membrane protein n=1 Tax=Hoyosella rhizosphaerae TaxID=1755582 RepID=A0A916UDT5_9ACTN|nr:MMPL family transporter [Hoyosella rhizosphaerae]MBN4925608.1 MMPL family transporter [Hoyosella rhizosphaerae]GGC69299.1 membrane protein [Hoyosella rhizosphaerae]
MTTLSKRPLRWLIPALLLVGWLALGGIAGPFAGKLGEVQVNDAASFLPASAESTEVQELQRQFADTTSIPAIIIAERSDGVTPDDAEYLANTVAAFAQADLFSEQPSPPIPSQDGNALQVVAPLEANDAVTDAIKDLRTEFSSAPEGLSVFVTGPAGQSADFESAFAGIDGLLLIVAASVVIVILVVVYRSPLLPFIVVISAILALSLASSLVYLLADADVVTLNGQSQGILFILVFGAATDYALLLVSRFREELRTQPDRFTAMVRAWKAALPPIAASAGTVIAGVLCLLLSDLNSNRGLGPVAAIGIVASFVATMTFLAAVLALLGRSAFWPARPKLTDAPAARTESHSRFWSGLARRIDAHPRRYWVMPLLVLLAFAAFLPTLKADGVAQSDFFLLEVESQQGQQALERHFDAGTGSPAVIIANADRADDVIAASSITGVAEVQPLVDPATNAPLVRNGLIQIQATLTDAADSSAAESTVRELRAAVSAINGANAQVGGPTAIQLDTNETSQRDRNVIIPLVVLVVFAILALLLRSLLAPLFLMGTVVLSFAATLGVSAIVFNHILGFPGADPVIPLFAFVFLVALGIDYNIFLMTRAREETLKVGTRDGVLKALVVTGGVITSAGIVLAATFAALAVIPLLFLAQIAFIVAFGVLLDALIMRSLLVPAVVREVGPKIWWPGTPDTKRGRHRDDDGDRVLVSQLVK